MSHNYGTDIYSFLSVPRTYHEIVSNDFGIDNRNVMLSIHKMQREGLITVSKHWHYQNDVFKRFKFYYQSSTSAPPQVVSVPYADLLEGWTTTNSLIEATNTKKRNKINKRIKVLVRLGLLEIEIMTNNNARGFARAVRHFRLRNGSKRLEPKQLKTNSNRAKDWWRFYWQKFYSPQRGDR